MTIFFFTRYDYYYPLEALLFVVEEWQMQTYIFTTTIERGGIQGGPRALSEPWECTSEYYMCISRSLSLSREKQTCALFHSGNRPLSFGMEYKRIDFCRDTDELWSLAEYEIRKPWRMRVSLAFGDQVTRGPRGRYLIVRWLRVKLKVHAKTSDSLYFPWMRNYGWGRKVDISN